jgi:hypothetical protein
MSDRRPGNVPENRVRRTRFCGMVSDGGPARAG